MQTFIHTFAEGLRKARNCYEHNHKQNSDNIFRFVYNLFIEQKINVPCPTQDSESQEGHWQFDCTFRALIHRSVFHQNKPSQTGKPSVEENCISWWTISVILFSSMKSLYFPLILFSIWILYSTKNNVGSVSGSFLCPMADQKNQFEIFKFSNWTLMKRL